MKPMLLEVEGVANIFRRNEPRADMKVKSPQPYCLLIKAKCMARAAYGDPRDLVGRPILSKGRAVHGAFVPEMEAKVTAPRG